MCTCVSWASGQFNVTGCGTTKGCFLTPTGCSGGVDCTALVCTGTRATFFGIFIHWWIWYEVQMTVILFVALGARSYAVVSTNDYVHFELMRPASANTYVAIGLSTTGSMVCTSV
jgi:hypothetical protein